MLSKYLPIPEERKTKDDLKEMFNINTRFKAENTDDLNKQADEMVNRLLSLTLGPGKIHEMPLKDSNPELWFSGIALRKENMIEDWWMHDFLVVFVVKYNFLHSNEQRDLHGCVIGLNPKTGFLFPHYHHNDCAGTYLSDTNRVNLLSSLVVSDDTERVESNDAVYGGEEAVKLVRNRWKDNFLHILFNKTQKKNRDERLNDDHNIKIVKSILVSKTDLSL